MDYEAYRDAYFVNPAPKPRFSFGSSFGVTLFYEAYQETIAFYEAVLGPPAYVEGEGTRGWQIGNGWLTLLKGKSGNPKNIEVAFRVKSPDEAERLLQAFEAAGGQVYPPTDQLMYEPIRSCQATDPFGTEILIFSPLSSD